MATIHKFEDIEAWKLASQVCCQLGLIIDYGDFKKSYRLISRIEASSGSIMDNIAEGFERGTKSEFIQFLGYSKGSCGEFRSQINRALDRNYITNDQFEDFYKSATRISSMLQKLITYLQNTSIKGVRKKAAEATLNVKP